MKLLYTKPYTWKMTLTNYIYQEKKEKEDSPTLKIGFDAFIHRLKERSNKSKEGLITAANNSNYNIKGKNQLKLTNKNGKKKLHTMEISKEKPNLL